MEDKFSAEAKDRILLALLLNQSYTTCSDIALDIKDSRYNEQLVLSLLKEIEASEYSILIEIDKTKPWSACANEGVKDFLVNGGFIMMNVKEQDLLALQKEKLINETKKVKKDNKYYWMPFLISGISTVIAIGSLWYAYSSSNNTLQEQYDAIESVKEELKQLRNDFKEENVKLKKELFEADSIK